MKTIEKEKENDVLSPDNVSRELREVRKAIQLHTEAIHIKQKAIVDRMFHLALPFIVGGVIAYWAYIVSLFLG